MKSNTHDLQAIIPIVLEELATYLSQSQAGEVPVLHQQSATHLAKAMQLEYWINEGGLSPNNIRPLLQEYLANTQHLQHPHYIGHQVATPHVASGIADFIHGVINNPMAIYEMGPAAATIEQTVINWMLSKAGWFKGKSITDFRDIPNNGGGVLTHGGSLANLTALLSARAAAVPSAWTEGVPDNLVVLGSEVAHYSVARAISIIGLGKKALIPVATTDMEVLRPDDLHRAYQQTQRNGQQVMAVIANACATSTGLYDPIDEIGQFCEENGLWFHVDGAHGASALITADEKHFLKGLHRADSMIWDTHKMLRTSGLCAAVLFRNAKHLTNTFQQKGSYLFHEKEQLGFDLMPYTIECTKAAIGTKLFWVLAAEGEQGLANFVSQQYQITRQFYDILQNTPDFYCPYYPQANILCFQYTKYGINSAFQLAIRNALVSSGDFYITSTEVGEKRYLRLTVINPLTGITHLKTLIEKIKATAAQLVEDQPKYNMLVN